MEALLIVPLIFLLGSAVWTDIRSHRIPNIFLLVGGGISAAGQIGLYGFEGLTAWAGGLMVGLLCFLPLYICAGMAAGDVKLISVAGSYFGVIGAFWVVAFSLIAGGVLGVLILLHNKQLLRFIQRYWAIASLRTYIEPENDDAARQRFPYAIAIFLGTLISIFWHPFGQ